MKKSLVLLTALFAALVLLTGCNQQAQQTGPVIGVVDEAAAFRDNKAATAAMAYLQEMGAPLQKKAEEAYNAMQADQSEENVAAYQAAMGELQTIMNAEQQRIVAMMDAKFTEALDAYRVDRGLSVILSSEAVISFDAAVDVTADIVAAMDAVELDLTPVAETEAEGEAQ